MSKRIVNGYRLLPLLIAACLLAAASPAFAGEPSASASEGVRLAGLQVSVGFHGHHHGHHGYYRPFRHHAWYGYYPYRYVYPHVYHHGYYGVPRYASRYGGLDLNVKPKKTTQVYVDGNYVGVTGNFDGWPEHLWLDKGSYELIFYNPGYETVVRHVEVQPGVVIKIREDMRPGEATPPEELTTVRPKSSVPAPRSRAAPQAAPQPGERAAPAPPDVLDARRQAARLKLEIAPADASVYLDGRFLGIAGEIGEQRPGILIDPGEHRLEIVRPGYDSRTLSFDAEAGGEVKLEIELRTGAARTGYSA